VNQVVKIFAEAWQDEYFNATNKIVMANAIRYLQANAQEQFMAASASLTQDQKNRLEAAFKHA